MNFIKIILLPILITISIHGTRGDFNTEEYVPCDSNSNLSNYYSLPITVYINGDTSMDYIWFNSLCYYRNEGFDFVYLVPLTVKVGAVVSCSGNNCCCPNSEDQEADCDVTFQNVCAQWWLGDDGYLNLLCCSNQIDYTTGQKKGFAQCVSETLGLQEAIDNCMAYNNPMNTALQNAQEVLNLNVAEGTTEPYILVDGIYDKCIDGQAYYWFMQTICSILDPNIAYYNAQCKEAMNWN